MLYSSIKCCNIKCLIKHICLHFTPSSTHIDCKYLQNNHYVRRSKDCLDFLPKQKYAERFAKIEDNIEYYEEDLYEE